MNQVITIMYQPGAYGSFLAWATERFSAVRKRYQPAVTDNPLLPDGSSHAYASFCKVKDFADFQQGLNEARWEVNPWHSKVYAGWPNHEINQAVSETLLWMGAADKLIIVESRNEHNHALRFLRNEATLDHDRWYEMLGISSDSELVDALRRDMQTSRINKANLEIVNDPRVALLNFFDILDGGAANMFKKLSDAWAWPTCDRELFFQTFTQMQERQRPYVDKVRELSEGGRAESPAEFAIREVLKERI